MLKDPSSAHTQRSPLNTHSWTQSCEITTLLHRQPAFQLSSKRQTKDFTTPLSRFRLQSSSRPPCLKQRCRAGPQEMTFQRKEKNSPVQKASLKNLTTATPKAERKNLTSALHPWQRACCAEPRRDKPQGVCDGWGGSKSSQQNM